MDGSNGSTEFIDSSYSPKTVTANSATITTDDSKFGGASGAFGNLFGGVRSLSIPSSQDFGFGLGDFCIEMFVKMQPRERNTVISIGNDQPITGTNGIVWRLLSDGSGAGLYLSSTYFDWLEGYGAGESPIPFDEWTHIALTRKSGTVKIFVGGQPIWSTPNGNIDLGSSQPVTIGTAGFTGSYWEAFIGCIDELRITKGLGGHRYDTNFTPPTAPFPNG